MADAILAIIATHDGNPQRGGPIGHWVRVSDNPNMALVNEFSDGGRYQHSDCGPACVLSTLRDRGIDRTAAEVEAACRTSAAGTTLAGLSIGLGRFGLVNDWIRGAPPQGWIMNPAGGRRIAPAGFPAYIAASQGFVVIIKEPSPWDAAPATPEDVVMGKLGTFVARIQGGGLALFVSDGMHFRHVPGPTPATGDTAADEISRVGPWFNGDGLPLREWSAAPVNDVAAFGTPANAATAAMLDPVVPFP